MLSKLQDAIFSATNPELAVFFWSMFPITELRASIPLAMANYGLSALAAFFLAVLGTISIATALLLLLDPVVRVLRRVRWIDRMMQWIFTRTRNRFSTQAQRYGVFVGLMIFVAVPLPGTGAWTGALAAYLVGMRFWTAWSAILFGLVISGMIVLGITTGALAIF